VSRYRLQLLGDSALSDSAGEPVALWRPMVALLALLAASSGGAVRREAAAALLWPDSDDSGARLALRQLLFRLRRTAPFVAADRAQVRLMVEHVAVDVVELEAAARERRLEEAVSLWRGPYLAGFSLPGSPDFDQWADTERERLRLLAAHACEALVDRHITRARWDAACDAVVRWLDVDPYNEAAAARALTVHAQRHDPGAALALFEAFRRRLDTDLGARPSPDLLRLAERVRQAEERGTGGRQLELPLVGREAEFARISECWTEARTGRHQLVLLRGEPGIGKSRLAAEFRRWAATTGATTLTCRAYEIEAGVPYAGLAGALREALGARGLSGMEARSVAELSRIVPEYAVRFPDPAARPDGALEGGHLRIMDAWRDLLDSLVHEAPLLLVVDDLPWADEASLAAIHYAWRTLSDRPFMILATARGTRHEDLGGAGSLVAAALRDGPDTCTSLVLGPLDRTAIATVAAPGRAAEDGAENGGENGGEDAVALEQRTGGNPLFLVELLRAAADGGSGGVGATDTIRLVVLDRIGRLEKGALALLRAAAILGRQFPLPLAASVAELPVGEVPDAVDALLDRGLVRQVEYGYDFVHDVVREVVRDDMGATARASLHRRAFLEMRPGEDEDPGMAGPERLGALARHAAAAGIAAEAYRWHLLAARSAMALYAPAEAGRALGQALAFAGSPAERREAWEAVAELAHARSDFRGAAVAYQNALDTAEQARDRLRLRLGVLHMGQRAGILGVEDVDGLAAELLPEVEAVGGAVTGELSFILADAHARARDFAVAARHAAAAAEVFRAAGEPRRLVRALLLHASAVTQTGQGDVLASLDQAERVARDAGLELERTDVRIERATELSRRGRWQDAIAEFERIRDDALEARDWSNSTIASLNAADLHARRGEWGAALPALAMAESLAERFGFPHVAVTARLNRALLEWLRGDGRAAVDAARAVRHGATAAGLAAPLIAAAAIEALASLEWGDLQAAASAMTAAQDADGGAPHPSWSDDAELMIAARARLLAAQGEPDAARSLLTRSRREAREPYAAALLTLEQAALERATDVATAHSLAAEALASLRALGAAPLAERAARLLGQMA
jgi:DNA-binding SARP family transcriptional activator/tetratricopeptide (TPR) repeat protein